MLLRYNIFYVKTLTGKVCALLSYRLLLNSMLIIMLLQVVGEHVPSEVVEEQVLPDTAKKIHAEFQPEWTAATPVRSFSCHVVRFNFFSCVLHPLVLAYPPS
jgi:hypothetical protein